MPIEFHLPADGRQSDPALRIARGTRRLLRQLGYASVQEIALPSGLRADILALDANGELLIVEIKSSIQDFRTDQKWQGYGDHCDRFFFAVAVDFPADLIPESAGLIVADPYGAAVIREAPFHRLAPATRKNMLLKFGYTAADRLHHLWDRDRDG